MVIYDGFLCPQLGADVFDGTAFGSFGIPVLDVADIAFVKLYLHDFDMGAYSCMDVVQEIYFAAVNAAFKYQIDRYVTASSGRNAKLPVQRRMVVVYFIY